MVYIQSANAGAANLNFGQVFVADGTRSKNTAQSRFLPLVRRYPPKKECAEFRRVMTFAQVARVWYNGDIVLDKREETGELPAEGVSTT